ncbi:aldo/keto reductase [Caldicellulosiruptoraceae bacterium PP1]
MLYRKFGKTNEMVSILGFGCMRLPILDNDPTKIDYDKATEMVRYAIDNGVNYIDTAYPYHGSGGDKGGASEPFVAKVLKDGYREKVKLATKLPSWLIKTHEDMDRLLNEQLKRLETDYIDFYLVHAINKDFWANLTKLGIDHFLNKALQSGKIKYAGFSFHDDVNLFKEVVDYYDWSFCQIQYNYLDEEYQAGKEGLQYAAKKGLGIVIMEPLRGGLLAKSLPQPVLEEFKNAKVKRTPAEWALRWIWNHEDVSVVLSGMNTLSDVIENIKTASDANPNSMTSEELLVIEKAKETFKKIKVNCTGCEYCMPCPSGVNIPKNFLYYNKYYLTENEAERNEIKYNYNKEIASNERASSCVECGKCETHCPQKIAIRQELKNVKAIFE